MRVDEKPLASFRRGFTLVEILIVVVLLGIIASILISQFNNSTADSKKAAVIDQLRSIRAQISLYKMQHGDQVPALAAADWTPLTSPSVFQTKPCGPYFPTAPRNAVNEFSDIAVVNVNPAWGDAVAGANIGFVYNDVNGYIWATTRSGGFVFNEDNLDDPANNN
jgi:general secretion pathway protein G